MYVGMYVGMYVCTYVRMYVCTYVCMYVCTYVRTYVRTYVCMYVCMYVCVCVCVTKLRVKDGVCESDVSARQCRHFLPALQCHLLCVRQHCGPGMGWMRCSMIFCAPCGATRCATWQPRLSSSHESDDDDIAEKYLAAKSAEHVCSWLSKQLWKTSTERMPVKSRHSHSGKHHGYDANCAVFSKHVNQPQISETHRRHGHSNRCRFAMHLHTLLPHWVKALAPEDIDSLTHCRAVRHAPVLRPRSPLDGHLSHLQTHRGFIRAILLLHDSGNQWNLTSSTILIHIGYIMQWIAVCRVLNLARMLSCHNMNPKNQSILDSLTTLDILLINRIDALELMS